MGHRRKRPKRRSADGRYAYMGLDRVIHERGRLGILTSLATHPKGLLFGDLKEYCRLTDGNLSRHLKVLHEADLVELWKGGPARPQTLVRLTPLGRRRFIEYVEVLEGVVEDALAIEGDTTGPEDFPEGWLPA